jgi:hypothetical protein
MTTIKSKPEVLLLNRPEGAVGYEVSGNGTAHYPQSQRPDLGGPAVTAFAHRVAVAPGNGASR